MRFFNNEGSFL